MIINAVENKPMSIPVLVNVASGNDTMIVNCCCRSRRRSEGVQGRLLLAVVEESRVTRERLGRYVKL